MAGEQRADAVRVELLDQLVDWNGNDLKGVYEPISWQIGNMYCAAIMVMLAAWAWNLYRKRYQPLDIEYKFLRQILREEEGVAERKRTCSVIGGTGVLGKQLVDSLLAAGSYRVHVASRRIPPKEERDPRVDAYIRLDVCNYDGLRRALEGVHSVFYCVGGLPDVYTSDEHVWAVNKNGAENLLSACLETGVKNLVFTSIPVEPTQGNPRSAGVFVRSKLLAEQLVFLHTSDGKMNASIVGLGKMYSMDGDDDGLTFLGYGRQELGWFPRLAAEYNFTSVSAVANSLVTLEQRLNDNCPQLLAHQQAKNKLQLCGEFRGTLKEFAARFQVDKQFGSGVSMVTAQLMARLNEVVLRFTGRALFGTALCPALLTILQYSEPIPQPDRELTSLFSNIEVKQ